MAEKNTNQDSNGALLGAIIIILLIIIGGFYLIKTKVREIRESGLAGQELINSANVIDISSDSIIDNAGENPE